ncbi:hypothetical protein HDU96_002275 [Phlyctochytrium bullatum]|nr:hypothetical protein HDU96_002275 [Phlyctochytrium bullatum]
MNTESIDNRRESVLSSESGSLDDRKGLRYPITPHQLWIYQSLHLQDEDDNPMRGYSGPPFTVCQAYRHIGHVVESDFALSVNRICSLYKVLTTRFWRNEKIVDGDIEGLLDEKDWDQVEPFVRLEVIEAEEYPALASLKPETLSRFLSSKISETNNLTNTFKVFLVREPSFAERKAVNYIVFLASTAVADEVSLTFVAKEIFTLYFRCLDSRQEYDSDLQVYSTIGSYGTKEEIDDFIDVAYGCQNVRPTVSFWKDVCIETVQDILEGPERDDIESQLKKAILEVENLRAQVQNLSKRKVELESELETLKEQRRQMEVENYESVEKYTDPTTGEVIEISRSAKSALLKTVLGDETTADNISGLLAKHEVSKDIQKHLSHMSLEAFSQVTEDQLTLYGMLAKDRRKVLALSDYVRNRIKECLHEQSKIKFALERKIMKLQREFDLCTANLKTAQNSMDANDDMSIRLKLLLNPPSIEAKYPILGLDSSYSKYTQVAYDSRYGFQAIEIDSAILKNIRNFRDRCRQVHKQKRLHHRATAGYSIGTESEMSSTEESNPPSEADEPRLSDFSSAVSADAVCLAAFQVMLKHIMGNDKYLLGVKMSLRKGGVLVGPLSDIMPLRVDLAKKGLTFNGLLVSVIKNLRDLKKHGGTCPYMVGAKRLELPDAFPMQFEFFTDKENQMWQYAGLNPSDILPKPVLTSSEDPGKRSRVEKVWCVDEQAGFDVKLVLMEDAESISGGIIYRREKFDEDKVSKWASKYKTTLEGIEGLYTKVPQVPSGSLSLGRCVCMQLDAGNALLTRWDREEVARIHCVTGCLTGANPPGHAAFGEDLDLRIQEILRVAGTIMSSKNFFAVLGEDDDVDSQQVDQKKATPAKEAASKDADKQVRQTNQQRSRAPRNDYPRRGGGPRAPVVQSDVLRERSGPLNAPLTDAQLHEAKEHHGGGRGRGRGGRGGYRGREFDRHSGNPRYDGEKKEIAGKGSWGNPVTAESEAVKDGEAPAEKENAENAGEEKAEEQTPPEPEEKLKTLEEYLAERAAAKPAAAEPTRRPNEGSDETQWKDAVVLQREEDEEYYSSNKGSKSKKSKETKAKVALDIEQKFADEYSGREGGFRGGRGGRGGPRGGYNSSRPNTGRGRGRGGASYVNVDDINAFPSLGSK